MKRWNGEERRDWLMLTAASLAGGQSAKQAVENADKISAAAKSRFPEEDDPEDAD
jgi:hypothetical protein